MSEENTNEEETKIRVASYGNTTWQGGWRQRGRAWWGTGVVGAISGALIGAALVGVEIWLGMPPTTSAILAPVMGLAAVGGVVGTTAAGNVGGASGSTSAGLAEWEVRFKQMMLEAGLFTKEMVEKEPVNGSTIKTEITENEEQANVNKRMFEDMVNVPALLTFGALGTVFGALLGAAGGMPEILMEYFGSIGSGAVDKLGLSAELAPAITGGTLFGASTTTFGINMPVITNKFNTFFSTILSGDFFKSNEHEQAVEPEIASPQTQHEATHQPSHQSSILASKTDAPQTDISQDREAFGKLQQISQLQHDNDVTIH